MTDLNAQTAYIQKNKYWRYGSVGGVDMPQAFLLEGAACGEIQRMHDLITKEGVNVNCRDELGRTPLMLAAFRGQSLAVAYLLCMGARPELCDDNGKTTLSWAAMGYVAMSARRLKDVDKLKGSAQTDSDPGDLSYPAIIHVLKRELRKKYCEPARALVSHAA